MKNLMHYARGYICPVLMTVQFLAWPFGREWHNGILFRRGKVCLVEVRAWWPRWLIFAEWRAHERLTRSLAWFRKEVGRG